MTHHPAGDWAQVKRAIRSVWFAITDEELDSVRGSFDHVVHAIERATGEGRDLIQQKLDWFVGTDLAGVGAELESNAA